MAYIMLFMSSGEGSRGLSAATLDSKCEAFLETHFGLKVGVQ